MSFWQKIKQTLRSFMNGRNGADQLSVALLWSGLILYLLGSILGSIQSGVVQLLGMLINAVGLAWCFPVKCDAQSIRICFIQQLP